MFGEKSIEVTISSKGNVQIEPKGMEGHECMKATKSLEEVMGKMKKRTFKAEYDKQINVAEKVQIGN